MAIDQTDFRKVLGHYPTGVCVITGRNEGGEPVGMAVGSFTSVSLSPPLVAFFPDRSSSTWPHIHSSGKFCVNILASNQKAVCERFARKGEKKFDGFSHGVSDFDLPVLDGSVAWIDCLLEAVHEVGDHFFAIGRVQKLTLGAEDGDPLLFFKGGYSVLDCGGAAA